MLGPCYHLLFSMLYYIGLRLTPVRVLERNYINLAEGLIYFPKVKGGKDLYLPLYVALQAPIEQYLSEHLTRESRYVFLSNRCPDQPLSPSDIRNKLRLAAYSAGLDTSITPHTPRHCKATHLTIHNVPQHTYDLSISLDRTKQIALLCESSIEELFCFCKRKKRYLFRSKYM
ncbi:tyrosine-type recombinase/integrase [Sporosarcina soli]|uniref:Tyrosine-type recombinase/integrase n=1 Tax=Sporosarcina soli TaxID=334736 RepID=A0ABW0TKZ6_9BACL